MSDQAVLVTWVTTPEEQASARLLIESIRAFGGWLSQCPIWVFEGDPQNAPYFYSNPWPFEAEKLTNHSLPEGARWFTESWQGTILPYDELAGDPNAENRLKEYARAVFDIALPTLMA